MAMRELSQQQLRALRLYVTGVHQQLDAAVAVLEARRRTIEQHRKQATAILEHLDARLAPPGEETGPARSGPTAKA